MIMSHLVILNDVLKKIVFKTNTRQAPNME